MAFRGIVAAMAALDLDSVQKVYNRYSGVYDFYFGKVFEEGRKKAIASLDCQGGEKVLEVGVGTGLSLPLYPAETEVYGIDISSDMLAKAKALKEERDLQNVKVLEVMNAQEMSFPDNYFDKVVAMYVATVVPDPVAFVNEVKRVCKPKGRIVLVNHFHNPKTLFGKVAKLFVPLSRMIGFHPNISLDRFTQETGVKVVSKAPVNLFKQWTVLVTENDATSSDESKPTTPVDKESN
ncbi:MAG: methyltransferase domain-containing protein [Bradymonadales bacterium]|nr:MAG: methyltransferase domain-containing protein [Bradymonadales bacterium]